MAYRVEIAKNAEAELEELYLWGAIVAVPPAGKSGRRSPNSSPS
jgi:hypothetical protein